MILGLQPVRVIIVDDEPHARRRIRDLLEKETDFLVIAECCNGAAAAESMRTQAPDVVFLDVRMPDLGGFEVLQHAARPLPWIVFVTAFEVHALDAFEWAAIDYLLKPFEDSRFAATLERIRRLRDLGAKPVRGSALQHQAKSHQTSAAVQLAIRSGSRTTLLDDHEVHWIEGDGTYVKVHTASETYLHREVMHRLAERLRPSGFLRVHRSAIVQLAQIRALTDDLAILRSGAEVRISARYRPELKRALGLT